MRSLAVPFLILLSAVSAIAQTPQREQQPPLSERIDVNTVLIDAIVTDRNGNQILGLTPDDFVVTEDGTPQQIDSLDYFTTRQLLTSKEESAPFKVEQVREERYIVFFFDKPENAQLFSRLAVARTGVNDFIENQMLPSDKVAIVGHDVRLKVYSDFTSNKAQLRRATDELMKFSRGILQASNDGERVSILRSVDRGAMMNKTGTTYEALTELADALRPIRARKNLVLFSAGIHEPGEEVRGGILLSRSRYYDPMIEALNAANVTVYSMSLLPESTLAPIYHQTLESLSHDTNGDYYRYAITYKEPLKTVAKASAGYYLLSYRTQKKGRGYQRVQVSVKNQPDLRVTARPGYAYGE